MTRRSEEGRDLDAERQALEERERVEGDRWAAAAEDPEFRSEIRDIARDLRYTESPLD